MAEQKHETKQKYVDDFGKHDYDDDNNHHYFTKKRIIQGDTNYRDWGRTKPFGSHLPIHKCMRKLAKVIKQNDIILIAGATGM